MGLVTIDEDTPYPFEGYEQTLSISNPAKTFKILIAYNKEEQWFGVRAVVDGKMIMHQSAVMDHKNASDLITFLNYYMSDEAMDE